MTAAWTPHLDRLAGSLLLAVAQSSVLAQASRAADTRVVSFDECRRLDERATIAVKKHIMTSPASLTAIQTGLDVTLAPSSGLMW